MSNTKKAANRDSTCPDLSRLRWPALAEWHSHDPHAAWLKHFLEGDLGGDLSYCDRILTAGRAIVAGNTHGWNSTGNAFGLHLDLHEALLHLLHDTSGGSLKLPLQDFLALIGRWHDFLLVP